MTYKIINCAGIFMTIFVMVTANSGQRLIGRGSYITDFDEQLFTNVNVHYSIQILNYGSHNQLPYVLIAPDVRNFLYVSIVRSCFEFHSVPLYDNGKPVLIHLNRGDGCDVIDGHLLCEGSFKWSSPLPSIWRVVVAYECSQPRNPNQIEMIYNFTMEPITSVTCRNFSDPFSGQSSAHSRQAVRVCSQYYPLYSPYNPYGFSENDLFFLSHFFVDFTLTDCYKYLSEALCRLGFPECVDGEVIYFCIEMCNDMLEACADVENVLNWFQACRTFQPQDSGQCIYREVQCTQELEAPVNGRVNVTSKTVHSLAYFHCDDGYKLVGNQTAVCTFSGNWSPMDSPSCVSAQNLIEDNTPIGAIVAGSTVSGIVLLICIASLIAYIKFQHEMIIIVFKYFRCLLCCNRFVGQCHNKHYHALLAYNTHNSDDRLFIKEHIQEKLDAHAEYNFSLYIEDRDAKPSEQPLRYLPEAISRSHRVVILLTQDFLDDNTCQFMLEQAFFQTLEGDSLKVTIILRTELKQLKHIPNFLKGFIRTGSMTLKHDDRFLIDKLIHDFKDLTVTERPGSYVRVVSRESTDSHSSYINIDPQNSQQIYANSAFQTENKNNAHLANSNQATSKSTTEVKHDVTEHARYENTDISNASSRRNILRKTTETLKSSKARLPQTASSCSESPCVSLQDQTDISNPIYEYGETYLCERPQEVQLKISDSVYENVKYYAQQKTTNTEDMELENNDSEINSGNYLENEEYMQVNY